jgi:hypothetical protein
MQIDLWEGGNAFGERKLNDAVGKREPDNLLPEILELLIDRKGRKWPILQVINLDRNWKMVKFGLE